MRKGIRYTDEFKQQFDQPDNLNIFRIERVFRPDF